MEIINKLNRYLRVLHVARKPSKDEFIASSKVCVLGLFVIGIIGFAIHSIFVLLGL